MVVSLVALILILNNGHISAQSDTSTLKIWDNSRLKWSDFEGVVPKDSKKNMHSALTCTTIANYFFEDDYLPNYKIVLFFQKKVSWARDTSSLILLEHEQGHFDIREIFARKIRKGIHSLREKFVTDTLEYEKIIKDIANESHRIDSLYDIETKHGTDHKKQIAWSNKIAKALSDLKDYEEIQQ